MCVQALCILLPVVSDAPPAMLKLLDADSHSVL